MSYYYEFQKLGIDPGGFKGGGKRKVVCPKCRDRKNNHGYRDKDLALNFDTGAYFCHSGNCNWNGYAKTDKVEFSRPVWKNKTDLPNKVVKFFEGRGISQDTLKKLKVSVDEKDNIEFNYFRGEELVNVKTRFEENGKKSFRQHTGAEKIVYNLNSIEGKDNVIVTEGEMDVASWVEIGAGKDFGIISVDQGAPSPGQKSDGKLECLKNCADQLDKVKHFFICTDKDAPGVYLQQELVRRFGAYRCSIVFLPKGVKDTNELIDRSKSPYSDKYVQAQTLKDCLKNAKPVPVPGIHRLDSDMQDLMLSYYDSGRPKGTTTHYPELDKRFTYLPGDLTVLTGYPGDGKSQLLRQLAVIKSKFDGWKWACFVPEDFPADYFFEDLCHIYIGKTVDKNYNTRMTKEEYIEAMIFIKDHFFCIYPEENKETGETQPATNKWINERINFLKLKHGINAVIKDPWNQIDHEMQKGEREDQYLSIALSREKYFAANFDAYIIATHPVKPIKEKETGEYPLPDAYSISGGSMWKNKADNVLVVYRPHRQRNPSDKAVEFHSDKIKKQKLVGRPGESYLYFDIAKNRYYELEGDFNPLEKKTAIVVEQEDFEDTLPF